MSTKQKDVTSEAFDPSRAGWPFGGLPIWGGKGWRHKPVEGGDLYLFGGFPATGGVGVFPGDGVVRIKIPDTQTVTLPYMGHDEVVAYLTSHGYAPEAT